MVWNEYRQIRLRLIILLIGWIPFALISVIASSVIFHSEELGYGASIAYMCFSAYTALKYLLYPCPQCGVLLAGKQLYRRSCPRCEVLINHTEINGLSNLEK